ncbi:hypothetical protein P280DRAFT_511948 [Massarina eburnea CBS 473.64]|uniref:Uncharacterized protein n=1 Tax=Massarina eburnea CBS 473.64 TaxID=1395130 RepID=A0A6A6RGM7_9PLEO|nr:hypothetical protein P280DRAFT_511948 [Massarina eburnea CBS 473.64]
MATSSPGTADDLVMLTYSQGGIFEGGIYLAQYSDHGLVNTPIMEPLSPDSAVMTHHNLYSGRLEDGMHPPEDYEFDDSDFASGTWADGLRTIDEFEWDKCIDHSLVDEDSPEGQYAGVGRAIPVDAQNGEERAVVNIQTNQKTASPAVEALAAETPLDMERQPEAEMAQQPARAVVDVSHDASTTSTPIGTFRSHTLGLYPSQTVADVRPEEKNSIGTIAPPQLPYQEAHRDTSEIASTATVTPRPPLQHEIREEVDVEMEEPHPTDKRPEPDTEGDQQAGNMTFQHGMTLQHLAQGYISEAAPTATASPTSHHHQEMTPPLTEPLSALQLEDEPEVERIDSQHDEVYQKSFERDISEAVSIATAVSMPSPRETQQVVGEIVEPPIETHSLLRPKDEPNIDDVGSPHSGVSQQASLPIPASMASPLSETKDVMEGGTMDPAPSAPLAKTRDEPELSSEEVVASHKGVHTQKVLEDNSKVTSPVELVPSENVPGAPVESDPLVKVAAQQADLPGTGILEMPTEDISIAEPKLSGKIIDIVVEAETEPNDFTFQHRDALGETMSPSDAVTESESDPGLTDAALQHDDILGEIVSEVQVELGLTVTADPMTPSTPIPELGVGIGDILHYENMPEEAVQEKHAEAISPSDPTSLPELPFSTSVEDEDIQEGHLENATPIQQSEEAPLAILTSETHKIESTVDTEDLELDTTLPEPSLSPKDEALFEGRSTDQVVGPAVSESSLLSLGEPAEPAVSETPASLDDVEREMDETVSSHLGDTIGMTQEATAMYETLTQSCQVMLPSRQTSQPPVTRENINSLTPAALHDLIQPSAIHPYARSKSVSSSLNIITWEYGYPLPRRHMSEGPQPSQYASVNTSFAVGPGTQSQVQTPSDSQDQATMFVAETVEIDGRMESSMVLPNREMPDIDVSPKSSEKGEEPVILAGIEEAAAAEPSTPVESSGLNGFTTATPIGIAPPSSGGGRWTGDMLDELLASAPTTKQPSIGDQCDEGSSMSEGLVSANVPVCTQEFDVAAIAPQPSKDTGVPDEEIDDASSTSSALSSVPDLPSPSQLSSPTRLVLNLKPSRPPSPSPNVASQSTAQHKRRKTPARKKKTPTETAFKPDSSNSGSDGAPARKRQKRGPKGKFLQEKADARGVSGEEESKTKVEAKAKAKASGKNKDEDEDKNEVKEKNEDAECNEAGESLMHLFSEHIENPPTEPASPPATTMAVPPAPAVPTTTHSTTPSPTAASKSKPKKKSPKDRHPLELDYGKRHTRADTRYTSDKTGSNDTSVAASVAATSAPPSVQGQAADTSASAPKNKTSTVKKTEVTMMPRNVTAPKTTTAREAAAEHVASIQTPAKPAIPASGRSRKRKAAPLKDSGDEEYHEDDESGDEMGGKATKVAKTKATTPRTPKTKPTTASTLVVAPSTPKSNNKYGFKARVPRTPSHTTTPAKSKAKEKGKEVAAESSDDTPSPTPAPRVAREMGREAILTHTSTPAPASASTRTTRRTTTKQTAAPQGSLDSAAPVHTDTTPTATPTHIPSNPPIPKPDAATAAGSASHMAKDADADMIHPTPNPTTITTPTIPTLPNPKNKTRARPTPHHQTAGKADEKGGNHSTPRTRHASAVAEEAQRVREVERNIGKRLRSGDGGKVGK